MTIALQPMTEKNLERFMKKVLVTHDGHWIWIGSVNNKGYGAFQGQLAHRMAYVHWCGPIDPGLVINHKCNIIRCVNPACLELTTQTKNLYQRYGSTETHCRHGHSDFRTTVWGQRACRTCERMSH